MGEKTQAEERTAPFVLSVPWLRPTYFVFQSSFLHSVGWKIHVWSLEGSDAALSQSCLRMLREEGDRECKIILPYPTPTALPLLHLLLNLGIFFFFNQSSQGHGGNMGMKRVVIIDSHLWSIRQPSELL